MQFRSLFAVYVMMLILFSCMIFSCGSPDEHISRSGSVRIGNSSFSGILHNNESNKQRQGSGFNPLFYYLYPGQNIYRDDAVGLNFEHIMNGAAAEAEISMFTPRKDTCSLNLLNDSTAVLIHQAEHSSWGIETKLIYRFEGKTKIDLEFTAILHEDKFPLGYVAFMWASYMNCALDRRIYFIGMNEDREEWMAFGEDTPDGFETGTIAHYLVAPLPYEEGAKTLNIIEDPGKKFTHPFYYGLVHGSGDSDATQDTMVYIMMFDQKEPIRFAMWNFFRDKEGNPDTHSPAWDWQYVIRNPKRDHPYHYRARIIYKPFAGRDDVKHEYHKWQRNAYMGYINW